MQRNRTIIWATILLTLLFAGLAFMVPAPSSWPLPSQVFFYLPLIATTIMACLYTSAAILFTINLDVYKAKLRHAYIAIAVGTLINGAGSLQVSIIAGLSAWHSPYVLAGGMVAPFLLGSLVHYLAIRYFARLVGTKHFLARSWIALPLALAIAFLTSLLPHVSTTFSEIGYDIGVGVIAWSAWLALVNGILILSVRHNAGDLYKRAMAWLAGALFASALVLVSQGAYTLITTDLDHILVIVTNTLTVISGLMWLRASYAFAITKYYQDDMPLLRLLFGQSQLQGADRPKTVVDMVTHAAGLVSNSSAIDPLLDDVRAITVKLHPGENPSDKDSQILIEVYLKIEHYLITKEPIRTFTLKELRFQLDPSLEKLIETHNSQEL